MVDARFEGTVQYRDTRGLPETQVVQLYRDNHWSSAAKPRQLMAALANSDHLISAWHQGKLVGLGNAISDGHLVVYYPHLLVHPAYQGRGIGRQILLRLAMPYRTFHQQVLVADERAVEFYERCGFRRANGTSSMWIYNPGTS